MRKIRRARSSLAGGEAIYPVAGLLPALIPQGGGHVRARGTLYWLCKTFELQPL